MARRTVTPAEVDMRLPLREQCLRGLAGTISPMLVLHHHGCERQCAELADAVRAHLGRSRGDNSRRVGGDGGEGREEDALVVKEAKKCWDRGGKTCSTWEKQPKILKT